MNKGAKSLCIVDESLDACRRSNPQAFFARKIICCEGKTEVGFIRAIDRWIQVKYKKSLSSNGVVVVNAEGGNKMYAYADKLKKLGFETSIFADDDKPEELKKDKEYAIQNDIKLFLCESGNCIEQQIIKDLPWTHILSIVQCSQDGFPYLNIRLPNGFEERIKNASDEEEKNAIRSDIVNLAIQKHKEWFKHIPGGEFLGNVVCESFEDIGSDKCMKQNIESLLKWCNVVV